MDGKGKHARPQHWPWRCGQRENLVAHHRCIVRNDELFHQSPKDQYQRRTSTVCAEMPRLFHLLQQMSCALDRTRDQLGEEAHKEQVVRQVSARGDLAPEHVYDIGRALERVERNTNRQEHRRIPLVQPGEADGVEHIQHVPAAEEVQVLTEEEDAEIGA